MKRVDRGVAPHIHIPKNPEVVAEKVYQSNDGVKLYSLDFPQFDVVRLSLVFRAGTKYQSKPFVANSTISMFSEGSQNKSSKEISDFLDFYGLYLDVSIDRDYSIVTICSLGKFFDKAVEIFEDITLNPTFPIKEFDVLKSKRKNILKVEREKVDYVARELFTNLIFGENHPYGMTYSGDKYDELTRQDLVDFYNNHYLRDNMFAVVSGNATQAHIEKVLEICDKFPKKSFVKIEVPEVVESPQHKYIERANSYQSAIKVGRVMFNKSHPDFIPMQVLCTLLGGYFGSRLIANIREDKGYTYSIFASIFNMEDSGHFVVTTEVGADYVSETISEIFYEMERLHTELVSEQELDMVRNVIIGEMLRIIDGPFGIADIMIENIQNCTDNSYIEKMVRCIKSVTPADLMRLAKQYLVPSEMSVVVVGNTEKRWEK